MLDKIKESPSLKWAVDAFIKVATGGFIIVGALLILQKVLDLGIDFSMSFGL